MSSPRTIRRESVLCAVFFLIVTGSMHAQSCKHETFSGTINGGQEYTHAIDRELDLHLGPLKGNWGWALSVTPHGIDEDWTYPLNPPLTGEAMQLGTGYGSTAKDKLSVVSVFRFPLTEDDYDRYQKMAEDSLTSSDPSAAGKFLDAISKAQTGTIRFTPLELHDNGSPETVKWLRFKVDVFVPQSYSGDGAQWQTAPCPPAQ